MNEYEVVQAKSAEEALASAYWKPGMLGRCCEVRVSGNYNGTYTVMASFEPEGAQKERLVQQAAAKAAHVRRG